MDETRHIGAEENLQELILNITDLVVDGEKLKMLLSRKSILLMLMTPFMVTVILILVMVYRLLSPLSVTHLSKPREQRV